MTGNSCYNCRFFLGRTHTDFGETSEKCLKHKRESAQDTKVFGTHRRCWRWKLRRASVPRQTVVKRRFWGMMRDQVHIVYLLIASLLALISLIIILFK